jgi:hypothetical protein
MFCGDQNDHHMPLLFLLMFNILVCPAASARVLSLFLSRRRDQEQNERVVGFRRGVSTGLGLNVLTDYQPVKTRGLI